MPGKGVGGGKAGRFRDASRKPFERVRDTLERAFRTGGFDGCPAA